MSAVERLLEFRIKLLEKGLRKPSTQFRPQGLRPVPGSKDEYEMQGHGVDHHIGLDNGEWVVDTFDSTVDNPEEAHLDSNSFPSLEEAHKHATTYHANPYTPMNRPEQITRRPGRVSR